jgi:hypothetical protein
LIGRDEQLRPGGEEGAGPNDELLSALAAMDRSADAALASIFDAIAELSLACTHAPREQTEPALEAFGAGFRRSLEETFAGFIKPEDLDIIVANTLNPIRLRRDAIEGAAAGTA